MAADGVGAAPADMTATPPDAGVTPPNAGVTPPNAGAMPPNTGFMPPDATTMSEPGNSAPGNGTMGDNGMAGGTMADADPAAGAMTGCTPAPASMFDTTTDTNTEPGGDYTICRPSTLGENSFVHPPIAWGNGLGTRPNQYSALLREVASNGFVVIANPGTGSNLC